MKKMKKALSTGNSEIQNIIFRSDIKGRDKITEPLAHLEQYKNV